LYKEVLKDQITLMEHSSNITGGMCVHNFVHRSENVVCLGSEAFSIRCDRCSALFH